MRATITVVRDDERVIVRPPRNRPLDLLLDLSNDVSKSDAARVLVSSSARRSGAVRDLALIVADDDAWFVCSGHAELHVDDVQLAVSKRAPLRDGSLIRWRRVELRFDVVRERPLRRLHRVKDLLLFDCGSGWGPGRWQCLASVAGAGGVKLARATAVVGTYAAAFAASDDDATERPYDVETRLAALGPPMARRRDAFSIAGHEWRRFDALDGVALYRIARRAGGLEPSLAITIAAQLARWFTSTHVQAPLALGATHFALTWDGELVVWPPLTPARSNGTGVDPLASLFALMLPESSAWFQQQDELSIVARSLWHRLVDPWLSTRDAQPGDLVVVSEIAAELERAMRTSALPPLAERRDELASIVRGLFPDEWQREQEVREELATLDDAAIEELWRRG